MTPGPIFELELLTTARWRRFYALRFAYGLALLALLAVSYSRAFGDERGGAPSIARTATFTRDLFQWLVLAQGAAVVFITPALVAGAIAGEVQRKTIHDLLTSDLSSAEIVLGKLAARLLQVGVFVVLGLPILLLAGLLGGLDPWLTLAAEAATLSTAVFLGGLSILASTQTRSVRGALNFTFTLALAWLILPGAIEVVLPRKGPSGLLLHDILTPINVWVAPTSPFVLAIDLLRGAIRGPVALATRVGWFIGLQLVYGAILIGLAVVCLRPSYQRREGGRRRSRAAVATRRGDVERKRPPCGDDPMIWKERFASRTPGLYRPLGVMVGGALGVLLVGATIDFAAPAFREVLARGYGVVAPGSARDWFLVYLRVVGTGTFLVYLLGVASDAAAGFTSEHENDTWISLITTPLTGVEIVRAKMLGAVWGVRHTATVLLALVLIGVSSGSVHPLGLLALAVELVAFTTFVAALGTWISLHHERTMPAVARTVACLVVLNGGTLLIAPMLWPGHPFAYVASTPLIVAGSLMSFGDLHGQVLSGVSAAPGLDSLFGRIWVRQGPEAVFTGIAAVLAYGAAAWALMASACRGFDAHLDRPPILPHGETEDRGATNHDRRPLAAASPMKAGSRRRMDISARN